MNSRRVRLLLSLLTGVIAFAGAITSAHARAGKEANWTQTVPGKGWLVLLRLYGPLEPWFDKTWRPGEFELLK